MERISGGGALFIVSLGHQVATIALGLDAAMVLVVKRGSWVIGPAGVAWRVEEAPRVLLLVMRREVWCLI